MDLRLWQANGALGRSGRDARSGHVFSECDLSELCEDRLQYLACGTAGAHRILSPLAGPTGSGLSSAARQGSANGWMEAAILSVAYPLQTDGSRPPRARRAVMGHDALRPPQP